MYKFKIGKAAFSYNFADANNVEKYEKALQSISAILQIPQTGRPLSTYIRDICTGIMNAFNELLGKGAARQIFGDTCDILKCSEALAQLVEAQREADKVISGEMLKVAKFLTNSDV